MNLVESDVDREPGTELAHHSSCKDLSKSDTSETELQETEDPFYKVISVNESSSISQMNLVESEVDKAPGTETVTVLKNPIDIKIDDILSSFPPPTDFHSIPVFDDQDDTSSESSSDTIIKTETYVTTDSSSSNTYDIDYELFEESTYDFTRAKLTFSDIEFNDDKAAKSSNTEYAGESSTEDLISLNTSDTDSSTEELNTVTTQMKPGINKETYKTEVQNSEENKTHHPHDEIQLPETIPSSDFMVTGTVLNNSIDFGVDDIFSSFSTYVDFFATPVSIDQDDTSSDSSCDTIKEKEKHDRKALNVIEMLKVDSESVTGKMKTEFDPTRYVQEYDVHLTISHDVFVVVEDQLFKCHKQILYPKSNLFRDLVSGRSNMQPIWKVRYL